MQGIKKRGGGGEGVAEYERRGRGDGKGVEESGGKKKQK